MAHKHQTYPRCLRISLNWFCTLIKYNLELHFAQKNNSKLTRKASGATAKFRKLAELRGNLNNPTVDCIRFESEKATKYKINQTGRERWSEKKPVKKFLLFVFRPTLRFQVFLGINICKRNKKIFYRFSCLLLFRLFSELWGLLLFFLLHSLRARSRVLFKTLSCCCFDCRFQRISGFRKPHNACVFFFAPPTMGFEQKTEKKLCVEEEILLGRERNWIQEKITGNVVSSPSFSSGWRTRDGIPYVKMAVRFLRSFVIFSFLFLSILS